MYIVSNTVYRPSEQSEQNYSEGYVDHLIRNAQKVLVRKRGKVDPHFTELTKDVRFSSPESTSREEYKIMDHEVPPHRDSMKSQETMDYTNEKIYIETELVGREESEPDIVASVRGNIDGFEKAYPHY